MIDEIDEKHFNAKKALKDEIKNKEFDVNKALKKTEKLAKEIDEKNNILSKKTKEEIEKISTILLNLAINKQKFHIKYGENIFQYDDDENEKMFHKQTIFFAKVESFTYSIETDTMWINVISQSNRLSTIEVDKIYWIRDENNGDLE